jgi:hypothetical protein
VYRYILCPINTVTGFMRSVEYYTYLQKAGECALKALEEPDPSTKRALEQASSEYLRRAALANTEKQRM